MIQSRPDGLLLTVLVIPKLIGWLLVVEIVSVCCGWLFDPPI